MLRSEAARALGVSPATISRLCSGERRPSLDLIFKIRGLLMWTVASQADALRESASRYGVELDMRISNRRMPRGRAGS